MMKLNLSGWSHGLIGLEDKVIDLSRFQIRPKVTEQDIRKHYEDCIDNIDSISEYFSDQEAFKRAKESVLVEMPKFAPRDPKYPSINPFNIKARREYHKEFLSIFDPNASKIREKYFVAACLQIKIPLGGNSPFPKLYNALVKSNHEKTPKKSLEAVMCMPNDRTMEETKASTIHETLHYFIVSYQAESGRLLTQDDKFKDINMRRMVEKFAQENVVEYLNDLLLEHDKEVLFQHRWTRYEVYSSTPTLIKLLSFPSYFLLGLGFSFNNLLPIAPIPLLLSSAIYHMHKKSKKSEFTQPFKRAQFKI